MLLRRLRHGIYIGIFAIALAGGLVAPRAHGQDDTGGDIIVSARTREESNLNVPVVETALSGQSSDRLPIKDLKEYASPIAGLSAGDNAFSVATQVWHCGVGTSDCELCCTSANGIGGYSNLKSSMTMSTVVCLLVLRAAGTYTSVFHLARSTMNAGCTSGRCLQSESPLETWWTGAWAADKSLTVRRQNIWRNAGTR